MATEIASFIAIRCHGKGLHHGRLHDRLKLGHQVGLLVVQFQVKAAMRLLQVLVEVLVRIVVLVLVCLFDLRIVHIVHFIITIRVLHLCL